jgi:hypothetical protein
MLFWYYLTIIFIGFAFLIFGHKISNEIYNPIIYILFWVVYIITILTVINSIFNLYVYLSINKKVAPSGEKGQQGQVGDQGDDGECDYDMKLKKYIHKILTELDKHYNIILNKANEKITGVVSKNSSANINNKYIKDTLRRILKSKQFIEIAQTQNVIKVIDYITEIFKRWLEILANADKSEGKKHLKDYMEIYGEQVQWEFITNPDNNPFNEIEKYDIYYWGLNKEFYPIKLKVCKKQPREKSNKMFKAIKTNLYREIYTDKGTGARKSLSVWLSDPVKIEDDTFYPIGPIFHPNYKPTSFNKTVQQLGNFTNPLQNDVYGFSKTPNITNVLVSTRDSKLVRQPPENAWSWKWNTTRKKKHRARKKIKNKVTLWNAEDFYEDGELYRCFGSMFTKGERMSNPTQQLGRKNVPIVCLNDKIVEQVPNNHNFIWNDDKSRCKNSVSAYANLDGTYNLGYFSIGLNIPDYSRKSFKIKDEILNNNDSKFNKKIVSTDEKNLSPEIGYQVEEYNRERERKDGIFDLLDLVIKADIESFYLNQKLNIEHSKLNDPNSYLIREYDNITKKINNIKCLKINEEDNTGNNVELSICNSTKNKQLWEIEFLEQSKELCLIKSKDNDKYLYLIKPYKYALNGNIPSRNINDKNLKPFIWKIISI